LTVAAKLVAEPCDDALIAGATSIADIDKLMGELQTAPAMILTEADAVQRGRIIRLRAAGVDTWDAERALHLFEANLQRFEEDVIKGRK
jgi:hypothetical protein